MSRKEPPGVQKAAMGGTTEGNGGAQVANMEQVGIQKVPLGTPKVPVGTHTGEIVTHDRPMGFYKLPMGVHKGLLCANGNL